MEVILEQALVVHLPSVFAALTGSLLHVCVLRFTGIWSSMGDCTAVGSSGPGFEVLTCGQNGFGFLENMIIATS